MGTRMEAIEPARCCSIQPASRRHSRHRTWHAHIEAGLRPSRTRRKHRRPLTGMRRQVTGKTVTDKTVMDALRRLAGRNPDVDLVCPVHLNPNVREPVNRNPANHTHILID